MSEKTLKIDNIKVFEEESLKKIEDGIELIKGTPFINDNNFKKSDLQTLFNYFHKKIKSKLNEIGISLKFITWFTDPYIYKFEILTIDGIPIAIMNLYVSGLKEGQYRMESMRKRNLNSHQEIGYELSVAIKEMLLAILKKLFLVMNEKNSLSISETVIIITGVVNKKSVIDKFLNETNFDAFYVEMDECIYFYLDRGLCEYEKNILQSYEALLTVDEFGEIDIEERKLRHPRSLSNDFNVLLNHLQSKVRVLFDYRLRGYVWFSEMDDKFNGKIDIEDMLTPDAIKESFLGICEELALADIVGVTKDFQSLFRGLDAMRDVGPYEDGKVFEKLFRELHKVMQVDETVLMKAMRKDEAAVFKVILNGRIKQEHEKNGKRKTEDIEYQLYSADILGVSIGIFIKTHKNPNKDVVLSYVVKKLEEFDFSLLERRFSQLTEEIDKIF